MENLVTPDLPGAAAKARPCPSGICVPPLIADRVAHLVDAAGGELESVLYYEHPLTVHGVVVVARDRVESYPDLLARAQRALAVVPALHCLRSRDLFLLALPGSSSPPHIDDQPHLAYCVKRRSVLLHGRDCRPEVPLPAEPRLFLLEHLRGCRHYFRAYYLRRLLGEAHRELVREALQEAGRLMSTALMGERGGWQTGLAEVPERFLLWYRSPAAAEVVGGLQALARRLSGPAAVLGKADAWEAARLFERLLDLLAEEGA